MIQKSIYLDNNATTRVDENVVRAMLPYFTESYGNASSKLHYYGWEANAALENACAHIANLIGAENHELIFTSGATESVNLGIIGIAQAYKSKGNHIITCKTEHKAVLDTCAYLEKQNCKVTYLDVDKEGLINLEELKSAINSETILVAIMAANNETGVIQPLEAIAEICNEKQLIFFSDATQFVGKERCDVKELGIHCMAFSAHKFYGPKGVGALYVSKKNPRINLLPQIHGGGHQQNLRSGTLNVPLIVGFGEAAKIAEANYWDISTHVSKLKNYFEHQLLDIEGLRINGSTKKRIFNTSNVFLPPSVDISKIIAKVAIASGSACASAAIEPSHVLTAMGLEPDEIKRSFRFSFGKYNTLDEVKEVVALIK